MAGSVMQNPPNAISRHQYQPNATATTNSRMTTMFQTTPVHVKELGNITIKICAIMVSLGRAGNAQTTLLPAGMSNRCCDFVDMNAQVLTMRTDITGLQTISMADATQALAYPSSGNITFDLTTSAARALAFTGGQPGKAEEIAVIVHQSAIGYAATLSAAASTMSWADGSPPTVSTMASAANILRLYFLNGTYFRTMLCATTWGTLVLIATASALAQSPYSMPMVRTSGVSNPPSGLAAPPLIASGIFIGDTSGASVLATGSTTPRTAAARAADIVNVRDFGASCNGSGTDDAVGFNAAIRFAQAHGKSEVTDPGGICIFKTPVVIPANVYNVGTVHLHGDGTSSIIRAGATLNRLIELQGSEASVSDFYFDNTTTGLAQTAFAYTAAPDAGSARFYNSVFTGFPIAITNSGNGLTIDHTFANTNALVFKNLGNGIGLHFHNNNWLAGNLLWFPAGYPQGPEGVTITDNEFSPAGDGTYSLKIQAGLEFKITNNTFGELYNGAHIVLDSTNDTVSSIKIEDNWLGSNAGTAGSSDVSVGIQIIDRPSGVFISNDTFQTFTQGCVTVAGTDPVNRPVQHLMIANIQTSLCGAFDISLNNALNTSIVGSHFTNRIATIVRGSGTTVTVAIGNEFAQAPQKGPQDIYIANTGQTADSLDNVPIGLNERAAVAGTSADFNGGSTFRAGLNVIGGLNSDVVYVTGTIRLGNYTVALLPPKCTPGQTAYASNGRNPGEAASAGTGTTVFCNSAAHWLTTSSGIAVTN